MIELNILPPEQKERIASKKALQKIISRGSLGLFLIFVFLFLLSSIWWYLLIQLEATDLALETTKASPQNKLLKDFEEEISGINGQLKDSEKLRVQTQIYSLTLERLIQLVPANIKFKSILIKDDQVRVEGKAVSREALLAFKDSITNSRYFEKLDAPLSNFLKANDIDFSFNFQVKK